MGTLPRFRCRTTPPRFRDRRDHNPHLGAEGIAIHIWGPRPPVLSGLSGGPRRGLSTWFWWPGGPLPRHTFPGVLWFLSLPPVVATYGNVWFLALSPLPPGLPAPLGRGRSRVPWILSLFVCWATKSRPDCLQVPNVHDYIHTKRGLQDEG